MNIHSCERQPRPADHGNASRPSFARWLGSANRVTGHFLSVGTSRDRINFGGGLPDPTFYPLAEVQDAVRRAFERLGSAILNYGPVEGSGELREAVAARTRIGGRPCAVANVLITSGAMQALDLLGKVMIEPGDMIAAQSPTYLGALDAWRPREPVYRLLDVLGGDAASAERLAGAKFAYVVPNFSNPTGTLIDGPMRARILRAATEAKVWLVEDDPYGALYFDSEPLDRIIDLDGSQLDGDTYRGPVIYLGTLSKSLVPGLRIGWVVADPGMIAALSVAKQAADLSTSPVTQAAALELMTDGTIERFLPRLLAAYRSRRDAICAAAETHLKEWFDWTRPEGGMFLWLTARSPALDTDRVRAAALELDLVVSPSSVFHPEGACRNGLRLNFTLNDEQRLWSGIERLAAAMHRLSSPRAT